MDVGPLPQPSPTAPWRPPGCDRIALVLQGGGALGAYQAGVYQALHEAGLEPDWVSGVSIGGINAAIIAGNPPERRLERLEAFWETITTRRTAWPLPEGDEPRRFGNALSAFGSMMLGQPGFFRPNLPSPWLSLRGAPTATSFYDTAPLRQTLGELVDFELINGGQTRFAVGAVNVQSGNFYFFDNAETEIIPEHVMASGALPPALPMVQIGTDCYWDGGLVSNTPLQHVLDNVGSANTLVFQVDLFSARGALPRDMFDVMARQKDIQYSSRTRLTTDRYMQQYCDHMRMRGLLAKIPEERLSDEERALKQRLADMPELTILHLIYQQAAYEGDAKDYEFSKRSMREHWQSGYRDTKRTLRHKEWLGMPGEAVGIMMHDVHRVDD